jgi:hypothetical protein
MYQTLRLITKLMVWFECMCLQPGCLCFYPEDEGSKFFQNNRFYFQRVNMGTLCNSSVIEDSAVGFWSLSGMY